MTNWVYADHVSGSFDRRRQAHSRAVERAPQQSDRSPDRVVPTKVRKTFISEESIGVETRTIDNRDCVATIVREIRVSKEWTHSIEVLIDRSRETVLESKLGAAIGLTRRASIDGSIRNYLEKRVAERFEIVRHEKRVCEELVRIDVPPNAYVKKNIEWKQVWQHGEVVFLDEYTSEEMEAVPFRFTDKISCDVS